VKYFLQELGSVDRNWSNWKPVVV